MSEEQLLPAMASMCLLLWLLAREPRINPALRAWLQRSAYVLIMIAAAYVAFLMLRWLTGI